MDKLITLKSKVIEDEYTDYIKEHFDYSASESLVEIPMISDICSKSDWNILVICGSSGSGKSTILRRLGDIYSYDWDNSIGVISNFKHLSPKDATMALCAMGLASVPSWVRPYEVLSNGEKHRADLAMAISRSGDDIVFIDEFTSVVDRNSAKAMSNALQKYVRREGKRVVLATCHYDILEWLQPDYIYDLNKGGVLERGDYLRRPQIELQVFRTTHDTWKFFKKHHYMTEDLNKSASCFVFTWNNQLVAFAAVLPQPSGYFQKGVRGSRTVVLPDFQGLGIGSSITDFLGGIYKSGGFRYFTKTVNPKLGEYRNLSDSWKQTAKNGRVIRSSQSNMHKNQKTRASYCHEYVGKSIDGFGGLIEKIDDLRKDLEYTGQLTLF